jgi:hypothetical protein
MEKLGPRKKKHPKCPASEQTFSVCLSNGNIEIIDLEIGQFWNIRKKNQQNSDL